MCFRVTYESCYVIYRSVVKQSVLWDLIEHLTLDKSAEGLNIDNRSQLQSNQFDGATGKWEGRVF